MTKSNYSRFSLKIQTAALFAVLIMALLVIPSGIANAERCNTDEAQLVANNWLKYIVFNKRDWAGSNTPNIDTYEEIIFNGELVGYYLDVSPNGFIVVPLIKELPPVKAYSADGRINMNETQGLPALIKEVLWDRLMTYRDTYGSLDAPQPTVGPVFLGRGHRENWERFLNDEEQFESLLNSGKLGRFIEGDTLLKSSWHQSAPYHNLCPTIGNDTCYVGCVATAAAQIMNFWNWPPFGNGSHSYTWNTQTLSADFSDPYDW